MTRRKASGSLRLRLTAAAVAVPFAAAAVWVLSGNLAGEPAPAELTILPFVVDSPPHATSEPPALVNMSPPAELIIPGIGVDAPVSTKGLLEDGTMEIPDGPYDVAWYEFTSLPGADGNAVFSGHLDHRDAGQAVFWRLDDLKRGDLIEVRLEDGSLLTYQVSLNTTYEFDSAPVKNIVGPTSREVVTLITCSGDFDGGSRSYSHRRVVRAERVYT